jgi:hypothetical protein
MGFTPNGCSLSPDGSWRHCCDEHDLAYFVGGSLRDKLRADLALARCITRSIGSAEALWTRRLLAPLAGGVYLVGVSVLGLLPWHWPYTRRPAPQHQTLAELEPLPDEQLDALDAQRRRGRSPLVAPPGMRRLARRMAQT